MVNKELAINGGPKTITKSFNLGATYSKEELDAVTDVIKSGTISGFVANSGPKFYGGEKVKELESLFVKYFKTKHAVASNSATSSLHSALVAMGIGSGDEVIVPAVSMSASASVILMTGAKPVFVDIKDGRCGDCLCENNSGCFNINTNLIEDKITKKTKAIMVVHLFGKSADMNEIKKLSKKYNLKVLEDCAQSPGTKYGDKHVGTFGDIGIFSFNQSKTISAGEGGVAITNNKKYATRMQLMRNHAEAMIDSFKDADQNTMIGFNYRITDLEAAVAVEQFKKLDKFNFKKIELSNRLSNHLKKLKGLLGLEAINNTDNVLFIYPIIFKQEFFKVTREKFVSACIEEGAPMTNGYTTPLVDLTTFIKYANFDEFNTARNFNDNSLIATKICHHNNVTNQDIDDYYYALKKVHDYYLNDY